MVAVFKFLLEVISLSGWLTHAASPAQGGGRERGAGSFAVPP